MFNSAPNRFVSRSQTVADDSNMIPLINIVFLMLIFFMVAGKIATKDAAQLEVAHTAAQTHALMAESRLILAADSVVWLDDQPLGNIESLTVDDWQVLEQALSIATSVVVKADAALPASMLDPLLERVRNARLESVQLAVRESP